MDLPSGGGVLLVDKPAGPTSHDVVAVARRALGTRRVGHTGTLDPFATGLLLLCVGPATRLAEFLTGLPKSYRARVRLGIRTDTGDPDGEVEATSDLWRGLGKEDVEGALAPLRGRIQQTPPGFSAKKVGGESAHYRVRRGETVSLAPVEVEVAELALVGWNPPELDLFVRCSSGTYVRVLARDLGETLGVGAHLAALRRTAVGAFDVEDALAMEALVDPAERSRAWISPAEALAHLPRVTVSPEEASRLAHGQSVLMTRDGRGEPAVGPVVVLRERELIAVASLDGDLLAPRKVFIEAGQ